MPHTHTHTRSHLETDQQASMQACMITSTLCKSLLLFNLIQFDSNMATCHNHQRRTIVYSILHTVNQFDSSGTPPFQSSPPTHLQLLHFPQSSARRQAGHSIHRTPLFRRGDSISERSGTGRFGTFGRLVRRTSSSSVHSSPPSSSTLISMPESAKIFI